MIDYFLDYGDQMWSVIGIYGLIVITILLSVWVIGNIIVKIVKSK